MPAKRIPRASPRAKQQNISRSSAPRVIEIANRHPRLRFNRRAVARTIHVLDAAFSKSKIPPIPAGELSLVFLTDAALAQLHADFLADPTPTDVITFEGDPTLGTTGEICVSADAALRHVSACASRPSPAAFSAELTLYLVHGWLHLAGFDDLAPEKKRAMRRAEARAMRVVAQAAAVPWFELRTTRSR
ncbi:MAG: rRNA maturation RNase YbeY [Opitutaceae bacterium]